MKIKIDKENFTFSAAEQNMIGDRIFCQVLRAAEKTEGGIYQPENAKKEFMCARVISVGPKVEIKDKLEAEDIVTFKPTAGTLFKESEVEYVILKETELLAFVKRDKLKKFKNE